MHLRWGEFELDEPRFELRKSGEIVAVQPKVLDLVLYLAKHRTRVVGKDELLQHVWRDVTVTEASLSQAVSLARRALDDTPEAQHTLRTVRGKGFQFVAQARQVDAAAPVSIPQSVPVHTPRRVLTAIPALGSSVADTQEDAPPRSRARGPVPCLFVLLHCELPMAGGARWLLEDIDEVVVTRGSTRRAERTGGVTRTLMLRLLGQSLSREHARLTRGREGWYLVDQGSKNGTFVNGERVTSTMLSDGDVIACGRTLLWFKSFSVDAQLPVDADVQAASHGTLHSLMPDLWSLSHELDRIAPAALPVLLLGETGVGKERVARALHRASGRSGNLVVVDAAARRSTPDGSGEPALLGALDAATGGTLLVEHVDRLPEDAQAALVRSLDARKDVRFIATSSAPPDALGIRPDLAARLSGYRAVIPPLRERLGDIGCLIAELTAAREIAPFELDVAAARALLAHPWPGNVRELDRCLQVAATLARGTSVRLEHLPAEVRAAGPSEPQS